MHASPVGSTNLVNLASASTGRMAHEWGQQAMDDLNDMEQATDRTNGSQHHGVLLLENATTARAGRGQSSATQQNVNPDPYVDPEAERAWRAKWTAGGIRATGSEADHEEENLQSGARNPYLDKLTPDVAMGVTDEDLRQAFEAASVANPVPMTENKLFIPVDKKILAATLGKLG
ncbi:hypothetical protein R1sor_007513 [Riccia sorocarpa]|uniref:Late embryogenesis abundant protein n=1 Tax=Riccia sorocarpa TaxID=122646 RepID=A0ABD3HTK5_9MARC